VEAVKNRITKLKLNDIYISAKERMVLNFSFNTLGDFSGPLRSKIEVSVDDETGHDGETH